MKVFERNRDADPRDEKSRRPLTWARFPWPTGGVVVEATCANGHTGTLSSRIHSVDVLGNVSPSYVCPYAGCGFHEIVRLADWEPIGDMR